jgi:branched-chain amino acid transport system permease protein
MVRLTALAWSSPPSGAWRDLTGSAVVAAIGLAAFLVFPSDLALLTRIIALAFLVLSLDLVVGTCGVLTLGHAALWGVAGYAAGFACLAGWRDPVLLVLIGCAAGAVMGLFSGALILRASGLAQLVMSIAVVQVVREIANRFRSVTGGSDGLAGIEPGLIVGLFRFDLVGRAGYLFALTLLVLTLGILQRVVASPFGLACRGLRQDPVRMRALGIEARPVLLRMYVIAGAVAGIGGALSAMTAGVVALDSVSFERSASALVMLVLGGVGTLYGALAGTVVFVVLEHVLAAWSPFHWLAMLGAMLIAIALAVPDGLATLPRWLRRRRAKPR